MKQGVQDTATNLRQPVQAASTDSLQPPTIVTPWGSLQPGVSLLPLKLLLLFYGCVYFLPFGIFGWLLNEDGFGEWTQFFCFAAASMFSCLVLWRTRSDLVAGMFSRLWWQWFVWLLIAVLLFFVAAEEVSWMERLTGQGQEWIREINTQAETNLHNISAFQEMGFLQTAFIVVSLLAGWIGWRHAPGWTFVPPRGLSMYFLPVALFYSYYDLSKISHGVRIRNDQELFELLLALGMLLHTRAVARAQRRRASPL